MVPGNIGPAGEGFDEGGGGGVDVGGGVAGFAAPLLGGHVERGAGDAGDFPDGGGDAVVDEFGVAGGVDHDVFGFVVAVHDALGVQCGEAEQRAFHQGQCGFGGERAAVVEHLA